MESFLRVGLMLFLSVEYYFCAFEKNESTSVIERRMIGGRVAKYGEFPFLVAIFEKEEFQGCFTLITSQTLIGAAHVVESYEIENYYGRIGDTNKYKGRKLLFRSKMIHPRYNSRENHDDIAVLIVKYYVENISPITLPGKNLRFTNGYAKFVGWGNIGYNEEDDTDILRVADVMLVRPKLVERLFDITLTNGVIVTMTPGTIAMKGDSGSPLIITDAVKGQILIGILSSGGTRTNEPDIYMSTSFYYDFIQSRTFGRLKYLEM
ncbi:venom protease-like [Centruroides sculpturatus]|uniref:venom protease-like n=1 Tax=Centruroides sculpturatus TaxID=218467 RepID=UPI000C6E0C0F|nr:venom protease-like [Centruroides sculpturatus]